METLDHVADGRARFHLDVDIVALVASLLRQVIGERCVELEDDLQAAAWAVARYAFITSMGLARSCPAHLPSGRRDWMSPRSTPICSVRPSVVAPTSRVSRSNCRQM